MTRARQARTRDSGPQPAISSEGHALGQQIAGLLAENGGAHQRSGVAWPAWLARRAAPGAEPQEDREAGE